MPEVSRLRGDAGRCLLALGIAAASAAHAAGGVTITFSGLYELDQVQDFYNGGLSLYGNRGPTLGVSFTPSATVASDILVGGHFITANEPSPPVTMAFNARRGDAPGSAAMNVPQGFTTAVSFYYSSPATSGTVKVYDGLNATGNVLATLTLQQTPIDNTSVDPVTHLTNTYSVWRVAGARFSGTAHSVDFQLASDIDSTIHGAAYDNITLGSSTPQLSPALDDPAIVFDTGTTSADSTHAALSQDGSVQVFQSQQTDLGGAAGNSGGQDVYSVTGNAQPVLESIDASGHRLIGNASLPAVSPDGAVIAFLFTPTGAGKDQLTGQMYAGPRGGAKHPVDVGTGGAAPNGSAVGTPTLSTANGVTQLAFCSAASNLVSNDSNGGRDIFLADPLHASTALLRISVDGTGAQLPGDSCEPKLSSDGSHVVFSVSAPTLYGTAARQIVMKSLSAAKRRGKILLTGQLLPVTVNAAGHGATADSSEPTVSRDGGVVAFTSLADLDGLGTPIGGREVYVSLAQSGARLLKRARSGDGTIPDGASQHPQVSDDGTVVTLQTSAKNFLNKSFAKTDAAAPQCGAIAITMNAFSPAALGGNLCAAGGRSNANQNPTISGDGQVVALDSNAPQPSTSSSNSNPYRQDTTDAQSVVAGLSGDYSGQWFDPNQSGQGLVIDELRPNPDNSRSVLMTWFVFAGAQPTWLQGVGKLAVGSGTASGTAVVQMDQVAIFRGVSFPLGATSATPSLWGSATLTFNDANSGTLYWRSTYPGFGSGTMAIRHFLPVSVPADDPAGATVGACVSGNWSEVGKSGHGFEFEVLPTLPPSLAIDWFAFAPNGSPVWLYGVGPITGATVQTHLLILGGSGAQFPPRFDPTHITQSDWGSITLTFADDAHAHLTWNSTVAGYGNGAIDLQPAFGPGLLARRPCD